MSITTFIAVPYVTEFILGQQIAVPPELLVKSGEDFIRTCTVPLSRGLNITCTLPISGSGSGTSSDTSTQRHNEATLYLRKVNKFSGYYFKMVNIGINIFFFFKFKLSNLKDRMTMTYHLDPILEVITATMIIHKASYLDIGCRLNNSVSKFNEIFVYPSHIVHSLILGI